MLLRLQRITKLGRTHDIVRDAKPALGEPTRLDITSLDNPDFSDYSIG